MKLEVFNVEHGSCAILTCDDGQRIMIDCGHNATSGWRPGDHLRAIGVNYLRALFVTNYDEDHVSGFPNLFARASLGAIFRNMSVSPARIQHLKTEDGMGPGIAHLVIVAADWEKNGRIGPGNLGLPANVTINTYCNNYGEFDDENNLSLAVEVICNGVHFLFTGDLEKAGWQRLIQNADVRAALQRCDVFFASHHGRESGCCDDVFNYCKPTFIVISDKAKGFQTQETHAYYHARARGGHVVGMDCKRFVLTTRSDGDITFDVGADGTFYVSTSWASARRSA